MITPFSVGKENAAASDDSEKINTPVLQSTPSRKPLSSLKGSENKNSLSSGPKRILVKQPDPSKQSLSTPGKTLKDGSTPSRYNYMQATEASKSLMPSPQRDPKSKQPSIARTPTRPTVSSANAKPSPQSNRKCSGDTIRSSPVKTSKSQQPSSPNKQQLTVDRVKPGKLNLRVNETSGSPRAGGTSGGCTANSTSARISKVTVPSSSTSTRISRTANNPSTRPASATSTAAFGLKRATNSNRQVVSRTGTSAPKSKVPTSTISSRSKSNVANVAANSSKRSMTATTTTGRTTSTTHSKQTTSTASTSKSLSPAVTRPSNAVGLQQRLLKDRPVPIVVTDSVERLVPRVPPVSAPAPDHPTKVTRQTSDCLENGVGEEMFVSGQNHANNAEDFSLQSLSFDMNIKPNMSFSSDVSSVDFKPESRNQSIDYSLGDIIRDEKGLLTDDKVNLSKNDLSAITVDFDVSASNSIEIITPSFLSQATSFDVINPPFTDLHPSFDRACEDGVRDSITTMSMLHSTMGSVPSCWTDLENFVSDVHSSHKSFSAVILQSTESLPKSTLSTQDSIQTDDPLNLGMLEDISSYDENGENLNPTSVASSTNGSIGICDSVSSTQACTDSASSPREALSELNIAALDFSVVRSKTSTDESDVHVSIASVHSSTTSSDSSMANMEWNATNRSIDLDTSFSRGCGDPVGCHLNGENVELKLFTEQFQPIVPTPDSSILV